MNKFILIALVATAFAAKCAINQELLDSNFDDYKLKYKISPDPVTTKPVSWPTLTTAKNIGFDGNNTRCGTNCWDIKPNLDTTFKIKGFPKKGTVPAGIRIYSQDEKKVVSWNQAGFPQAGKGYYMYDVTDEFIDGGYYAYYTLFAYNKDEGLEYMTDASTFAPALQVFEKENYGGTHIFQSGGTGPTQFCFVKVTDPTPPKVPCKVDDFSPKLQQLKATFTETKCTANSTIQENDGCEASCKKGFKGDNVKYTCKDGNFTAPQPIDCKATPFVKLDSTTSNCLAGGYVSITTETECTSAATNLKLTFIGTTGDQYRLKVPPGCYYEETNNVGVWFNPNLASDADGKTYNDYPICAVPKTCAVDDQTPKLTGLNAEFKAQECLTGKTIDSGKTCTATCKAGKTGNTAKYTCKDGKLTSPTTIDCSQNSTKTCKVDDFSTTLKTLKAEFKEDTCKAGSKINENDSCEASCKNGKGDNVKYFCHDDGNFKPEAEAKGIACTSSFVQIGVLGALFCLFALN